MSDETGTFDVTYEGSAAFAGLFAQMLRDEGVTVEYEPPEETRGLGADAHAAAVQMVATGGSAALALVVKRFVKRWPKASVTYEPRHKDESRGHPDV